MGRRTIRAPRASPLRQNLLVTSRLNKHKLDLRWRFGRKITLSDAVWSGSSCSPDPCVSGEFGGGKGSFLHFSYSVSGTASSAQIKHLPSDSTCTHPSSAHSYARTPVRIASHPERTAHSPRRCSHFLTSAALYESIYFISSQAVILSKKKDELTDFVIRATVYLQGRNSYPLKPPQSCYDL